MHRRVDNPGRDEDNIARQERVLTSCYGNGRDATSSIPEHVVANGPWPHVPLGGTAIFHDTDELYPPPLACCLPEGVYHTGHRCTLRSSSSALICRGGAPVRAVELDEAGQADGA